MSKFIDRYALLFLLLGFFKVGALYPVQAQTTNPTTGSTTITATVKAHTPPTTPILVSPTNNSYVTISRPTFIWEESTDVTGMSHYELSRDGGAPLFDNIPLVNTDNSDYTLSYDSTNKRYSLTPKANWAEGSHTWKIRAINVNDLGTDSATWTFTIDTQAPNFVLTKIGTLTVSISAQDPSTIPSSPLELAANEPLLEGNGEANASVQLTVIIAGEANQVLTNTITGGGGWSRQLGILTRDQVVTLNLVVTDVAGNVSVLNGVQFIIPTQVIVIPPSPAASPAPSPTPLASGETPPPSPELPPSSPQPLPLITIPVLPPKEIVHQISKTIINQLPPAVADLVVNLPTEIQETVIQTVETIAPAGALVASVAAPTVGAVILFSQLGENFSLQLLLKILQALGLLPKRKPQGMVFNSQTEEPVAFALLTFTSVGRPADEDVIKETVISDVHGLYQGIKLPPGKYTLTVSHQDYIFPTVKDRPRYLTIRDFYRGEVFETKTESEELLYLVPLDPKEKAFVNKSWRSELRLSMARFRLANLMWPLFGFSLIIAMFVPTLINWSIVSIYVLIFGRQSWIKQRVPKIGGKIVAKNGLPIPHAIIRLTIAQTGEPAAITTSDENGEFLTNLPHNKYQIMVTKQKYLWIKAGSPLALEEIDNTLKNAYLEVTLTEAAEVYQDIFG